MSNPASLASSTVIANTPPELATKLYPPRLQKSHVARPRLDAWFGGKPSARVALVCAPAGAGKSALAAQWLARTGTAAAWVTLEASDGRPQPFFALVLAAIRAVDPELAPVTAALVSDPRAFETETVTQQLIAELSAASRPLTLVIDDYHNVESLDIHRAMSRLIQNMPAAMRLVIIGRDVPPLELDALDLNGELARLGQPELSFTRAEALGFYRQGLSLRLTEREVDGILTRTGGLAAGLQLAGVALRNRSRVRSGQSAPDIPSGPDLWETLLEGQPAEVQSFLLRTSILRRFTADSCDAVTGIGDSLDMIRRWEREGLFLEPLDDRGHWYRYHDLFADILRARLTRAVSEEELAELHRRASTWLETHGHVEEAVYHSMAAHDWDRAVTLLEAYCSGLFDRDHIATLRVRLEGLPDEIFARSPRLAFWLAWAIGRDGDWKQGFPLLEIAQAAWTSSDEAVGRGLIELWHAARAIYDFDSPAAIALADRALDSLPIQQETARVMALMTRGMGHLYSGEPAMSVQTFAEVRRMVDGSGQAWLRPFEMTYSAKAAAQQGQLPLAAGMSVAAVRGMGEPPVEIWAQPALTQLGDVLLEWGRLEDAQEAFSRALALAERSQALHWRSRIRIGLARTAWAGRDHEAALAEIDRALDAAETIGNVQDARSARAWQARFWLESGQLGQARRWADDSDLSSGLEPTYGQQVEYLTLARLLIRERQPDRARIILQRLADQADAAGRVSDLVEIEVLAAIALMAEGDHAGARNSLNHALELGRAGGFLRVFVNEGERLESLLRQKVADEEHRDYAARILEVVEGIPASP
jgi:ATP/maltotriose-dependent transcriptional regulator MalT